MNHTDFLERYSRQIRLPQIGESGQTRLQNSRVLIIGLGGLGSPVAMYLAAAGVGHLVLTDYDRVDESNLQRQIIHNYDDIGESKVDSAAASLLKLNPDLNVTALNFELDEDDLLEHCQTIDLIVDCTDNFPSRFTLNDISIRTKTPIVSGAAIRWEGQVTSFNPKIDTSPCYQCLYQDENVESASCSMEGVISPLVGIIGSMQALESINILLDKGQLHGQLWLFDGQTMDWTKMKLPKNPYCPACSKKNQ